MFCLSKGLCAPVGSLLLGSRDVDLIKYINKYLFKLVFIEGQEKSKTDWRYDEISGCIGWPWYHSVNKNDIIHLG